jgi:hypothetical protein
VKSREKPHTYPGWLGKPTDMDSLALEATMVAKRAVREIRDWSDADWDAAYLAAHDEAMQHHGYRVMLALMDYFKISPRDTHWGPKLAWKLAALHVPANQLTLQRKLGRPRTVGPRNHVARLFPPARKSPGAPIKWTMNEYRALLNDVERGKAQLRKTGKRATNAAALYAVRGDRRIAKAHARRVSDARKALRKPEK